MTKFTKELIKGTHPIIVAFSGGKDSIAMVLYLLDLGIDPQRIHLHHHDVDGHSTNVFDWECTPSYCMRFAKHFNIKLFFSFRLGGIAREIYRNEEDKQDVWYQKEPGGIFHCAPAKKNNPNTRYKFPQVSADMTKRWCSASAKIEVLRIVIAHMDIYRNNVTILTGERWGESNARSAYLKFQHHATAGKRRKAPSCRIIIHWTEQQVWDIMKKYRVQPHPAYMLGWPRCSCKRCIFNSPNIWATIEKLDEIQGRPNPIADIESDIDYTLYHKMDIKTKASLGKAYDNLDPYWVDQALGEFTAPIIIDNWQLPPGAFKKEKAGSV